MGNIINLNEPELKEQLRAMVRGSVEETLNAYLDAEADRITNAMRYERTAERKDTRAGTYRRKLMTTSGEVELKVPKLRTLPFETAIIERYKRRETSVEEALIEMYLAGVSVRRVEDITEALWGAKVSPGTISELNKKAYAHIETWRNRSLACRYPYVYMDGIYLKRNWGGSYENVSVLAALAVREDGYREIIGAQEGGREDAASWEPFMRHMKERGLSGVRLIVGDKCLGLADAAGNVFPEAKYQRCVVHFYRNVLSAAPKRRMKDIAAMLKAIHAQEDRTAAQAKAESVITALRGQRLTQAAAVIENGIGETLTYMDFPREHWIRIRTNNGLERIMREVRRRTRVVGTFPDGNSALMLVCARLRYITSSKWGEKVYLNMKRLDEPVEYTDTGSSRKGTA